MEEGTVVEDESLFRLPQHQPSISDAQRRELDEYVALLESNPFSPPNANLPSPDLLNVLIEERKVVKVSDTVIFTSNAYQDMVDGVVKHLESEGKINHCPGTRPVQHQPQIRPCPHGTPGTRGVSLAASATSEC